MKIFPDVCIAISEKPSTSRLYPEADVICPPAAATPENTGTNPSMNSEPFARACDTISRHEQSGTESTATQTRTHTSSNIFPVSLLLMVPPVLSMSAASIITINSEPKSLSGADILLLAISFTMLHILEGVSERMLSGFSKLIPYSSSTSPAERFPAPLAA